ncbi:sigma factor (plasmid) [Mesorhizobium atlanticum]|uniref:sigma factor n=1 Tax=Mesorhizobium atlanticum TaxID=2233532 RepID=UPI003703D7C9
MHSIRHTYDPARPFGPWLVAIANRRFVDRLRRQGRTRARETPPTARHTKPFLTIKRTWRKDRTGMDWTELSTILLRCNGKPSGCSSSGRCR